MERQLRDWLGFEGGGEHAAAKPTSAVSTPRFIERREARASARPRQPPRRSVSSFGSFDGAESIVVQPDGKIVAGGFAHDGARSEYALLRTAR